MFSWLRGWFNPSDPWNVITSNIYNWIFWVATFHNYCCINYNSTTYHQLWPWQYCIYQLWDYDLYLLLWSQHVITSEQGILQHAIEQLKKIPLKEQRGPQERLHLKSLHSRVEGKQGFQDLSFLQSFLSPIQKWADKQLGDYHLHFAEVC